MFFTEELNLEDLYEINNSDIKINMDQNEEDKLTMCDKPYTPSDKWTASILAGLLYSLMSSVISYRMSNSITKLFGFNTITNGCPNISGFVLHSILFGLIIRLLLECGKKSECIKPFTSFDKWTISGIASIMFVLFSSALIVSSSMCISNISSYENHHDNTSKLDIRLSIVHTIVFIVFTRAILR